jgi:predicted transcriptional regulator YdeE
MAAGEAPENATLHSAEGFVSHLLPPRTYAVFRHRGLLADLGRTYKYAFGTWFPGCGRESLAAEHFEYRNRDYPGDTPDSVTELWIPLAEGASLTPV